MPKLCLAAAALLSTAGLGLTAVSLPAVAAPAAPSEATWSPSTALANHVESFDLAGSPTGGEAVTWVTPSKIFVGSRSPGGQWQQPESKPRVPEIDPPNPPPPSVVMDGRGDALAGWDGAGLMAAYHASGGSWEFDAEGHADYDGSTRLAANGVGNVLYSYTWTEPEEMSGTYVAVRAHGGSRWQEFEAPPRPDGTELALTNTDHVVAVFADNYADPMQAHGVYVLTGRPGAPSSSKLLLPGTYADPRIATDGAGDMVVATSSSAGLRAPYKPAGAEWQIGDIVPNSAPVGDVAVAIDEQGTATVAYVSGSGPAHVMAISRTSTGEWSAPVDLSGPLPSPYGVDVATDAYGNVAAIWSTDSTSGTDSVQVALHSAGQTWQPATQLAGPNTSSPSTEAANIPPKIVAAGGRFTAAYVRDGALQYQDFVADDSAPTSKVTGPGARHVLGSRFRVSWKGVDDYTVAGTDVRVRHASARQRRLSRWSRWLTNTTRSSKTFRGADGTTYCFSVRAHDAVGNVGPWSEARCATTPLDDRSSSISSGWRMTHSRAAYRHTLSTTRQAGHRLVWRGVYARRLQILAQTCPQCGSISVRQGRRDLGVISLHSRRVRNKRVLLARRYRTLVHGPVVIRVISHGKPVRIDGIIAER